MGRAGRNASFNPFLPLPARSHRGVEGAPVPPGCAGRAVLSHSSVTPGFVQKIPSASAQDALSSGSSRNDCRVLHPPCTCLSLGAPFFPAGICTVKKEQRGKLSCALLLITSLWSWLAGTWSYAAVYDQPLLLLEIIVPGTKVKGDFGASSMNSVALPAFFGRAVLLFCCITLTMCVLLVLDPSGTF